MQKRAQAKKTATSVLLLFAMLIVSVAVYFPVIASSDGNRPPERLMCMYPYPSQSIDDPSITLRFAFTIESSFNGNVGIVYSFSNQNPTVGGTGCTNCAANVYYPWQAITWHSTPLTPGLGRKWAMGETGAILKADYSDPIYVRAYVSNGSGTAYTDVLVTSVEEAFLKDWLESFHSSDFGGSSITPSFANSWDAPPVYPTTGQHPRVLFNASNIAGINAAIASGNTAAANAYLAAVADPTDGILNPASQHTDGFHNFDQKMLADITALALNYQLTGNTLSGYRAIYAAKNYLVTMDFDALVTEGKVDYERYYGLVMYTMACVYDWCYDLLTLQDKTQIVAGVQHKCCEGGRMEIGFPPSLQSPVTDHGSEFQLLRDYLAFAIAIYDEYPGWYDYIAGRFYQQYVPVRNEFYEAGMVPQGTSQYVQIRFASDLYSALLIKAATGTFPYASQSNMQQVMHTVYEYELMKTPAGTNGKMMFGSGDGSYANKKLPNYGTCSLIASHLFNDRTARAFLESDLFGGSSYSAFSVGFFQCFPTEELICSSGAVQKYSNRHQNLSPIVYNGGWLGQIIAHNNWSGTGGQAATLMKIGVRSAAGHEHQDAGQFQIFYKGILAGDSGVYASYGSAHHKYYHQATIAHNSLLIYNPAHKSENKEYYSGGQRVLTEPQSLENWENGWYETGTVTGYRYDAPNWWTGNYAYIAGDITPAYDSDTVSEVNRRMLTVFTTGDSRVPMLFFVYDNITATSGSFKKTFLLHTVTEPVVSGNRVTVTNGEGRLVLQSLFGGDNVVKRGGGWDDGSGTQGKNYYVNKNGLDHYVRLLPNRDYDDGYWGRVEISPNTGSANDQLLNAMYVCDNSNDPNLSATSFSTSVVKGAVLCNTVAAFVISSTPRTSSFSFNPASSGTKTFYVSGVADGNWTVTANGTTVGTYQASGGLLVFEAPASGTIQLSR